MGNVLIKHLYVHPSKCVHIKGELYTLRFVSGTLSQGTKIVYMISFLIVKTNIVAYRS